MKAFLLKSAIDKLPVNTREKDNIGLAIFHFGNLMFLW